MTTDRSSSFLARLTAGRPLLLDGATGTELDRRGMDTSLPLWSARALIVAPNVVQQIHRDYLDAGTDILTTNTFRTHRRTLTRAGIGVRERTHELTQLAVQLARDAIEQSGRTAYVAGSMSPLEDCYSPQLVPPDDELRAEHLEMAQDLADAGLRSIVGGNHEFDPRSRHRCGMRRIHRPARMRQLRRRAAWPPARSTHGRK